MFNKATFYSINLDGPATDDVRNQTLSVVIIETVLLAILLILGTHSLLTVAAQQWGLTFKNYLLISPLSSLACLALTILWKFKTIQRVAVRDYKILIYLFLLSLTCGALALVAKVSTDDDFYYVPNAVYFLGHQTKPMDFSIHFLVGSNGSSIISPYQGTAMSYDYLRAVIANYLKKNYLKVYFLSGALASFTLPLAYFLLVNQFAKDSNQALTGTIFCIALILISLDGGNLIGSPNGRSFAKLAFWYSYQGKWVALLIGIPLFTAFSLKLLKQPSVEAWIYLFLISTSMVGMSISSTILVAILAGALFGGFVLATMLNAGSFRQWRTILLIGGAYFSSLGYLLLYALFSYLQSKLGTISGDSFTLVGGQDFMSHFWWITDPRFPLTPILMIISLGLMLVYLKGWQRNFLFFWTVLLLIFFLNPFATQIINGRLIPRNIYWRIFYLLPFPLVAGVTLANLSKKYKHIRMFVLAALIFGIVAYGLVAYSRHILTLSIAEPPVKELALAQKLTAIAPAGVMLAPPNLFGPIPMMDGFHPQIRIRIDGDKLWLKNNDVILRENASSFVGGNVKYFKEFSQLLKEGLVQTVVMKKSIVTLSPIAHDVMTFLQENGFINQQFAGAYLVAWK